MLDKKVLYGRVKLQPIGILESRYTQDEVEFYDWEQVKEYYTGIEKPEILVNQDLKRVIDQHQWNENKWFFFLYTDCISTENAKDKHFARFVIVRINKECNRDTFNIMCNVQLITELIVLMPEQVTRNVITEKHK